MESQPALAFRFSVFKGGWGMKFSAVILAALSTVIFFMNEVEAADIKIDSGKNFVEQKYVTPPRLRRPLLPPMRTPRKDFIPRQPRRPKPHYLPHVPKPTNDNRGGRRKNFGPPQNPHR